MSETDSSGGVTPDIGQVEPEEFVKLIAGAGDAQIAELMTGPQRKPILDAIFDRMSEFVDAEKAKGTNAVVHFKLNRPEAADGGYDEYEVAFDDGVCSTTGEPERKPDVEIQLQPADFVKLASNQVSGASLFMSGKLKVSGDVILASKLTGVFRTPTAS